MTWTFIDANDHGALCCSRCGARITVTLPIHLEAYVAMIEAFEEKHAKCEPKEEREGTV